MFLYVYCFVIFGYLIRSNPFQNKNKKKVYNINSWPRKEWMVAYTRTYKGIQIMKKTLSSYSPSHHIILYSLSEWYIRLAWTATMTTTAMLVQMYMRWDRRCRVVGIIIIIIIIIIVTIIGLQSYMAMHWHSTCMNRVRLFVKWMNWKIIVNNSTKRANTNIYIYWSN